MNTSQAYQSASEMHDPPRLGPTIEIVTKGQAVDTRLPFYFEVPFLQKVESDYNYQQQYENEVDWHCARCFKTVSPDHHQMLNLDYCSCEEAGRHPIDPTSTIADSGLVSSVSSQVPPLYPTIIATIVSKWWIKIIEIQYLLFWPVKFDQLLRWEPRVPDGMTRVRWKCVSSLPISISDR